MADERYSDRSLKRVTVRFGVDRPKFTGFSKNLSPTGLYLKTPKVFKPGTVLNLEIRFKDLEFRMQAEVVWSRVAPPNLALVLESGMGLHFVDPTAEWQAFNESLKR